MIAKRKLSACHTEPRVSLLFIVVLWTARFHFAIITYCVCSGRVGERKCYCLYGAD